MPARRKAGRAEPLESLQAVIPVERGRLGAHEGRQVAPGGEEPVRGFEVDCGDGAGEGAGGTGTLLADHRRLRGANATEQGEDGPYLTDTVPVR